MNTETKIAPRLYTEEARPSAQPIGSFGTPRHGYARLDRLGFWLSALCAVHCMLMPIALISFPVVSWIHWSRIMDGVALAVAAVFGFGGCLLSLRQHRDATPLCLVFAGLMLNGVGRLSAPHLGAFLSQTFIIAGPLIMAYGLWRDRRLCACDRHTRSCCLETPEKPSRG